MMEKEEIAYEFLVMPQRTVPSVYEYALELFNLRYGRIHGRIHRHRKGDKR
jgi:hypothetical protein